ncbi:hypothetical protein BCR44DRAFT_1284366 [Catenaria anguillulae PL171]|uniref:Uncharacterized protein n=1 Tax=Catenaria anguillulae PL171 TaxID=765915 RepID=A0A1Y2HWE7_9FUNG|nr:hypothetical protein BCR44DRAFT_1284366 [Catenaria anguillulae PL171]
MLKFGRIVDLDRLEKMGVNKAAEDLRVQIAEKERQQARELEAWDHKISELKKRLTAAVVENTKQLEAIYELTVKRKTLEQALDTEQTAVLSQYGGPSRQEIEEQNRLISTVQRQAQEIEELKVELTDLLRKPGPVVPPILPKSTGQFKKAGKAGSSTTLPPLPREQPQAQAPPPMVDSRTSSA